MNKTKDTKELTNKVLVNIMIDCMLNPDNEDFYIGKLTKEKLQYYIDTNKGMEHIYREAYAKAKANKKFSQKQKCEYEKEL